MVKKGIQRFLVYGIATLIVSVLLMPFILEPIINTRFLKQRISDTIQAYTQVDLDPDQFRFELSPGPGMRFMDADLPVSPAVDIHIGSVFVELDMMALFRGDLAISRVLVESPQLTLAESREKPSGTGPSPGYQGFAFRSPKQAFQDLFALFPDSRQTLELVFKNATTDYFGTMDGSILVSTENRTLVLNADFKDLDLARADFPRDTIPSEIHLDRLRTKMGTLRVRLSPENGFNGRIRFSGLALTSGELPENDIGCDALQIGFALSEHKISVNLDPTVLAYPKGSVSVEFRDDRQAESSRILFAGNNIDIAQAREATLGVAGPNEVVDQLFDILRGGTAENVIVEFRSNSLADLFDGKKMILKGHAKGARVKIPETPLFAERVNGNARVENGILSIAAAKGMADTHELHDGWLEIGLIGQRYFKGEFNLTANLAKVPATLISLLPDTGLAKEMAMVTGTKGRVPLRLGLGMARGQTDLDVIIQADEFSGTGRYDRIPFPLTISGGEFRYEDHRLSLGQFSGQIGNTSFSRLDAAVDFSHDDSLRLTSGDISVDLAEAIPWLQSFPSVRQMLLPVTGVTGRVDLTRASLRGPALSPEKWRYQLTGSGRDMDMAFGMDMAEIRHLSGRFTTSNREFSAAGMSADITGLRWLAEDIGPANAASIKLPLKADNAKLTVSGQESAFSAMLTFPSLSRLGVDLIGEGLDSLMPRILTVKDEDRTDAMVMFNWDPEKPLLSFEGKLDTRTLELMLQPDSELHRLLTGFTAGDPVTVHTDAYSNLVINTRQVNLDSLLGSSGEKKTSREKKQPLFAQTRLKLTTDRLIYKSYPFEQVDTAIIFKDRLTDVQVLHADLCGLDISGALTLDRRPEIPLAKTDFQIHAREKENIGSMMTCLYKDVRLIEGGYAFNCHLNGQGPLSNLQKSLDGDLQFTSENGRIYKLTLLSRLLSVLNILKLPDITQEGFGYRSIKVQGRVEDGVIQLDKAVIDAENMALIFHGWVAPFENELNLTCLVAPFKTIDTIIQYIPIVNTLLSGRLVSFPAKATGPISDPVVTPLHPSAVGEGLVNMLGDILKTPVRLFEESP